MRTHPRFSALVLLVGLPAATALGAEDSVPALLQRQTQELVDAVGSGDVAVWNHYLDPDVRFVDEEGTVSTKAQMLEQIRPLPGGVSGSIRVADFDAVVRGGVAVATYVNEESENYHGHELRCHYRTTDTWVKTSDGWRLLGSQVLALRTDPPAVALSEPLRREYAGRYVLAPDVVYEIRLSGNALEGQQNGRKPEPLLAEAPDVLFVPGKPRYRYVVLRDAGGRITGFAQRREAWDLVWTREKPQTPGR